MAKQKEHKQPFSGLNMVGNIPWGTHFCQFYQTKDDLSDILVRYFEAGLVNNEFCVWVTSEFLTKEEALLSLKKHIPDFSKYLKNKQVEIFPYTEWYLKQGKFEMKRVLNAWLGKYKEAMVKGFAGMRVSGNPFWIDNKKDWDDFASYEAEINNAIGPSKLLVLCTYSLDKCRAGEVIDVVSNHEFALIKRNKKWELIKNARQKKAEEMLKLSEKRFQNTLDFLLEGAQIISPDYKYLYINNAVARQGRSKREKLLGKTMMEMYPGIENTEVFKKIKKCMEERIPEIMDTEFTFPNGTKGWFELSIQPVPEGVFILSVDMTERKKLERLKDEFLGVASHELKTPMTSIKAYAQVLHKILSDKGDTASAQMLSKMDAQANRIISLISDLLDITRIQEGKLRFNSSFFDFNKMVAEVIEEVQLISVKHKIVGKFTPAGMIRGDKERLGQVVINFLTNAVKYSPRQDKVIVRTKAKNGTVTLEVSDFGKGIPKEKKQKIFERFYRLKETGKRTPTGLGLGLYISSEIIKRHNGEVGVKSTLGKGSTFYFSIPGWIKDKQK